MRMLFASVLTAVVAVGASAQDKGVAVQWGNVKSTTPAGWKEETPSNTMRLAQFKLAKEKGDPEDAELALFVSPGGGTIDANLERQVKKFELGKDAQGKDAVLSLTLLGPAKTIEKHKKSFDEWLKNFK